MIELSNIQVSEGTITEPVTLDEIKSWLQIDFADFDILLTGMGTGARVSLEQYCNLHFVTKDVTLDLCVTGKEETVVLPYAKGVSAVVVKELDDSDDETTLASGTDYFVRGNTLRISPGRFSVAYTTVPGTLPESLNEAIKMEVAERFARRGENNNEAHGLSEAAKEKANPYVITWL